jgi:Uncharacterized protein conserved in bacteria
LFSSSRFARPGLVAGIITLAVAAAACGQTGSAQNTGSSSASSAPAYPTKAIDVIVPFSAGGFTDSSARVAVEALKTEFGQPVTVSNKEGAGGVTATTEYLRATPDGYSIMALISGPTTEALAANPALPYKWDSFTVLGGIGISPRVIITPVDGRLDTAEKLVDALKKDPGSVSWATGSPQGPATFSTLALFDQLKVDAKTPKLATFNGDGPAANAVAGGHVDFSAVNVSTALPLIKAGKVKPIIVSGSERVKALPDTPVASEVGLKEFILDNWLGFMAPAETPDHIVAAWEKALESLSKDPQLQERLEAMGMVVELISAAELTDMVEKRFETSSDLVAKFGTS